jgi:hypothetical protein
VRDNKSMISSPYLIILSAEEHAELAVRANGARAAHRNVVQAHIILAAADGRSNATIAAHLRLHVDTVRKWRRRFHQQRLAGLTDRPRTGRPRRFSAVQVAEVKAPSTTPWSRRSPAVSTTITPNWPGCCWIRSMP